MGLVLVFDLDQTILDSSDPYLFNRPNTPDGIRELKFRARQLLNPKLLNNVIKRAVKLRGKKDSSGNDILSGIFLLTNNSSKIMVSGVDSVLLQEVRVNNPENPTIAEGKYMTPYNTDPDTQGMPSQTYFFDSILMREHNSRIPGEEQHSPVKNLDDVKRMLGYIGVEMSDEELKQNTFFFDDMDHPGMTLGTNYIRIVPPYNTYTADSTNYMPVLQRLSELDGQPIIPVKLTKAQRLAQKPLTVSRTMPVTSKEPEPPFGRRRSGAMNEQVNNMELPPTQQETTVRASAKAKPSVLNMFTAKPSSTPTQTQYRPKPGESMRNFMIRMGENTSGGRRKSRTRKNRRNKTRKSLRK